MSVGGQVPILSGAEATRVDTRDVSEADTRGPRDAALLLRGTQQPGAEGGGRRANEASRDLLGNFPSFYNFKSKKG